MPRVRVTLLALLLSAGAIPAQAPARLLTVEQQRADFDRLRRAVEEAHGGLHRWVPAAELARRLDAHRARLDAPRSVLDFAAIAAAALSELRDGHARLELDSASARRLAEAPLLPLRVALEGGRVVVTHNDTPADSTIRPGMELLSIDGRPVAEILARLLPTVSRDGFVETGRRARLGRDLPRLYWTFVGQPARFAVEARGGYGRTVRAELSGVREADRRANANPVNAALVASAARLDGPPGTVALQFLDGRSIARLRVRAFDGASFPASLDSAFATLHDSGTRALVLDLRGNGGGVDEYGAALVSHLVSAPFRYFDHIHVRTIAPSFATWLPRTFEATRRGTTPDPDGGFRVRDTLHRGVALQRPAARPFAGRLVVLIDGGSFSTTADVAAQLRSHRRALFVGEETAGTYEGNTSGLNAAIVLPHSGLRHRVMMYGYWNAVSPPATAGRGVIPDHEVPRRTADLLAGRDPQLDRALALLR